MNCVTCGSNYYAEPRHDYGYCSEACETKDYVTMDRVNEVAAIREQAKSDVRQAHARVREARSTLASATEDLKGRIDEAYRMGVPLAELGRELGLSRQRIHGMLR